MDGEICVLDAALPGGVPGHGAASFDEIDIRRCLPGEIEKGRSYCLRGAVHDLRVEGDGNRLVAEVQGTAPHPYVVEIEIAPRRRVKLRGRCTCPVRLNCKHCAAALLCALETPPPGLGRVAVDPLAGPVRAWLAQLPREFTAANPAPEKLFYRLDPPRKGEHAFIIEPRVAHPLKSGRYGSGRSFRLSDIDNSRLDCVQPEDRLIARLMRNNYWDTPTLPADPAVMNLLMQQIIATGRCRWRELDAPPLTAGPPRRGQLIWQLEHDGYQRLQANAADGSTEILASAAPWYVDLAQALAGPLDFGLPPTIVAELLRAPPVAISQAAALSKALTQEFAALDLPRPLADVVEELRDNPPIPVLQLVSRQRNWSYSSRGQQHDRIDVALLGYEYDGKILDTNSAPPERRWVEDGRVIVRKRHYIAEAAGFRRMTDLGLGTEAGFTKKKGEGKFSAFSFRDDPAAWGGFLYETIPALRQEGWRVEIDPDFRPKLLDAGGEWDAAVTEQGGWWFALDLGVEIDGARISLLPVLTSLLKRVRNLGAEGGGLDALAHNGIVFGQLGDGRHIALPLDRIKAILGALVELYSTEGGGSGSLEISLGEAAALASIEAATRLRWLGGERLRALVERLQQFSSIAAVAPPAGLQTQLRSYQQDGLNWLQFLRAFELSGILADDMGLGKTVQTLAHILIEKEAGRLDRPCLVVCPTSVVPNWRAEAARLAPDLRVLSLHGADRAARFAEIADSDIVLTTYALLPRDADRLLPIGWHIVVLDEAQAIKNAAAKATHLACQLEARHRLCLTGTPVENHLGELWSQFAFLMPGLLGDAKRFGRVFRTPIEKHQDGERRAVLAARLKPFLLRRTKANVAADLPPKSEITQPLELVGAQRDLYETVRLAMHEKVRQEVTAKGFARSHIVILDALLKLRQVCCDPRLVKLTAARGVTANAKLRHLQEMLPALVEEGRRILLFSQFTSMLDLIKPELTRAEIDFVELRGDTKDRAAPVARFQGGEVPLFLISLRAGGTGLNLTAADTVIHYDPWWNPAVEDQATDRAHRIGQDKAVFVYKLVTQRTVEERMIELQERKRGLASGILGDGNAAGLPLAPADLEHLFEPIA
ncbi:MAG TPA: DEAD/DEAH box helicase [Stellaceae bacterium]|jgi:superfamily II DNA or RNA helicase|nr:DEAD/DEAH box helicase [Stellaceae bacterium]